MEFDDCDHLLEELGRIEGKNVSEEMMTLESEIREAEKYFRIFGLEESMKWKIMIPPSFC